MALPVNDIIAQLQRGNQGDVGDGEAEDGGEEGEEVVAGQLGKMKVMGEITSVWNYTHITIHFNS